MRIRRLLAFVALLFVGLLAAGWALLKFAPEVTLEFTQQQLQEQVAPKFPQKKCVLSACIELSNPKVLLINGSDRVAMEAEFTATLGTRSMPGLAKLDGRPVYEQISGNFYLREVKVLEFKMSGNAPDFDEVVKVRGPAVMSAIMSNVPLYSVSSHPKYGAIAKSAMRSVQVGDGKLRVVFGNPLLLFNFWPFVKASE
jgi:Protein of unknown function (DUF1439)